jgi:transposase
VELEMKITSADQRIERAFRENAECKRIAAVEGIGPVTATAVVAAISDGHAVRNGRQFAAWLGLVPRQHSNGGKSVSPDCWASTSAAIPIYAHC